jgi:hypothetical protein
VDKEGAMENSSNGKYFSKGFIESFRAKFAKNSKQKAYKIRANKTRFMEETLGGFAKKPFGNTKSVVEYLVDTPIK